MSLFTGASLAQLFMLIVTTGLISGSLRVVKNKYFYLEFFQLESLFRLFFSTVYASAAAGCLVKVWQSYGINYIHILEIKYSERLNPFQLWKPASVFAFFLLSTYLIFFEQVTDTFNEHRIKSRNGEDTISDEGQKRVDRVKTKVAALASSVLFFLWLNPFMISTKLRFGVFKALRELVIAPFGLVHFRAYLVGEILTDCVIQLEDIGKVITYLVVSDWNLKLLNEK